MDRPYDALELVRTLQDGNSERYFKSVIANPIHGVTKLSNALLIKYKNEDGDVTYVLKKPDGTIEEPSDVMLDAMIREIETANGGKLANICGRDLNPAFLKEGHQGHDINLYIFNIGTRSNNTQQRPAKRLRMNSLQSNTLQITTTLLGFVFIKIKTTKMGEAYLYIDAICAKRGLGSPLIDLVIHMGKALHSPKVELTALDKPIGFYLHKGFYFVPGQDSGPLENPLTLFQSETNESDVSKMKIKQELLNHIEFMSPEGLVLNTNAVLSTLPMGLKTNGLPRANLNSRRGAALGLLGKEGTITNLKAVSMPEKAILGTAPVMEYILKGGRRKTRKSKKTKKNRKTKKSKKTKKTRKTRKN